MAKPIVAIVGRPNVGKSTFINKVARKKSAKASDRPGVTRGKQWVTVDESLLLLDTPGILWPKFEDPQVGLKLAFIGSIKETTLDIQELAVSLLSVMQKNYPDRLEQRYKVAGVQDVQEPYELLEMIAAKRGMLLRKGEYDTERAAVMLLDEYRSGKLGKITLD